MPHAAARVLRRKMVVGGSANKRANAANAANAPKNSNKGDTAVIHCKTLQNDLGIVHVLTGEGLGLGTGITGTITGMEEAKGPGPY